MFIAPNSYIDYAFLLDHYSSLVDDLENLKRKKTKEELTEELNEKLKFAIESENYEEASRIRDYMKVNNIQKL